MNLLQSASQVVVEALDEGRIGTAESVRLVAHTIADHGRINDLLCEALEAACRWLDASPQHLAAQGSAESGQITTLMRCPAGQTATLSVGTRGSGAAMFEVVVVGSEGILAWESDGELFGEEAAGAAISERARRLSEAVHASINAGRAVAVPDRGQAAADARESPMLAARPEGDIRTNVRAPTATPPPYGVLLVAGAHTHQENYAQALAEDPRCRLVGLTDEPTVPPRRAALNARLAETLGIPLLPDLDEALARRDVQIVSICAEPERRGRIITRSAKAGKHLYLDKPMTASVAEAEAVVREVEQAGVVSQMFSLVHTPPAQRAREVLRAGVLGEIVAVHCDLFFAKGLSGTAKLGKPRIEQRQPKVFELVESKRELFNVGVYPLVLIHWLLGRKVIRVNATTANYFFGEHQENDMEDFAQLLLELEGGVTATIAVGRTGWQSSPTGGLNRTYLVGAKATMLVDAARPRLAVWAKGPAWQPPPPHPDDPMGMWSSTQKELGAVPKRNWIIPAGGENWDARSFLDCVEQGRRAEVSAVQGAHVVQTLMAAYESAATGSTVGRTRTR